MRPVKRSKTAGRASNGGDPSEMGLHGSSLPERRFRGVATGGQFRETATKRPWGTTLTVFKRGSVDIAPQVEHPSTKKHAR